MGQGWSKAFGARLSPSWDVPMVAAVTGKS